VRSDPLSVFGLEKDAAYGGVREGVIPFGEIGDWDFYAPKDQQ